MTRNRTRTHRLGIVALFATFLASGSNGYELETHAAISEAAASSSDLRLPTMLARLGLRPLPLGDPRQTFISSEGSALSILALMQFGARWEDELAPAQALRHFYDPFLDRALDVGGNSSALTVKSPDWALEDGESYLAQTNSYRDARNYFFDALTGPTELARRKSFGLLFQSLGQVIHHLQDMAQPQHVRNDPHCDSPICQKIDPRFYSPSHYEKYTDLDSATDRARQIRVNLPFLEAGSSPVYPGVNVASTPFRNPRHFWRTTSPGAPLETGKGIAEYTNRNFFSAGTIGSVYPLPLAPTFRDWYEPAEIVDVQQLLPGTTLRGHMRFFPRPVTDAVDGTSTTNTRAMADALVDGDLAEVYSTRENGGTLIFALNRFTFDAAHRYLIPRAVAYSSGLINYFLRGRFDVRQPDEGAYAIVDHAVTNQRNSGFSKLKLQLKNITAGGTDDSGNELIERIPENSTGSLVAIVKFHRNNCYQANLSGEYGSPGVDWRVCRSPAEEIVVSKPTTVPSGINDALQPMMFDFSESVVPINATDVFLQVVYRGPLGEESDALIVMTKDISEPTYNYVFNTSDQFLYCGYGVISSEPPCPQIYTFEQSFCQQANPELTIDQCRARHGRTAKVRGNPVGRPLPGYDPANPAVAAGETIYDMTREVPFDPLFALPTPVGTLTRVAVLTDLAPQAPYVVVNEIGVGAMAIGFNWWEGQGSPTVNQLDQSTDTMIKSRSYVSARGVFVDSTPYSWNPDLNDAILLNAGNAPDIRPLTLIRSEIMDLRR